MQAWSAWLARFGGQTPAAPPPYLLRTPAPVAGIFMPPPYIGRVR